MSEKNEVWPNGMPEVGQTAQRSKKVTAHDIELFTEMSGDRNPLHYDEEIARATRFGGIVVQGGVTSAILNAVVAEDLPGLRYPKRTCFPSAVVCVNLVLPSKSTYAATAGSSSKKKKAPSLK